MQTETHPSNSLTNMLSRKLVLLQPRRRATNQTKFAENYDDILDAINRGVSSKAIRTALAEEGITMSSATFKKLLEAERQRRDANSDDDNTLLLFNATHMEQAHV
jgi:hypothetical protein